MFEQVSFFFSFIVTEHTFSSTLSKGQYISRKILKQTINTATSLLLRQNMSIDLFFKKYLFIKAYLWEVLWIMVFGSSSSAIWEFTVKSFQLFQCSREQNHIIKDSCLPYSSVCCKSGDFFTCSSSFFVSPHTESNIGVNSLKQYSENHQFFYLGVALGSQSLITACLDSMCFSFHL